MSEVWGGGAPEHAEFLTVLISPSNSFFCRFMAIINNMIGVLFTICKISTLIQDTNINPS